MAKSGEATLLIRIKEMGSEVISKTKDAIKDFGQVALGVFTALSALAIKAVQDYEEQEKAVNQLTQALINSGKFSNELRKSYLEQASALQALTTFGDEQIIAAQAQFAMQVKSINLTQAQTMAILDFAQANGMTAADAAEKLGKAVGTSTNALARYGIEITQGLSSSEKMEQAISGLNAKFGGQAAAATQGLGAIKQLQNIVSDLFETLGEKLTPVVILLTNWLKNLVTDTASVNQTMSGLLIAFKTIAQVGSVLWQVIAGLAEMIGTTLAASFLTIKSILSGDFSEALTAMKNGIVSNFDTVVSRAKSAMESLEQIGNSFIETNSQNHAKDEENLKKSLDNKKLLIEQYSQDQKDKQLNDRLAEIQQRELNHQEEMALEEGNTLAALQIQKRKLEEKLKNETDFHTKMQIANQIAAKQNQVFQALEDERNLTRKKAALGEIATLMRSGNATLGAIGKAAALAQIYIQAPVAFMNALAVPPYPVGLALAAGVALTTASQVAQVMGVQLAEGGLVMPRPGGVQATIAEAGQPEVVIPLDRMGEFGLGGGGVTIIVNGGLLGDEKSAHDLAIAVDRQLLKLRQNGESVAFDERVV